MRFGAVRDFEALFYDILTSRAWAAAAASGNLAAQARLLASAFGPAATAHPVVAVFDRELRNQRIREEFDGRNYQQLAMRHGLTDRQVRRIVARKGERRSPRVTAYNRLSPSTRC